MRNILLMIAGITFSFNAFSASEKVDCSNKQIERYFLLGTLSKKLQSDLKEKSPKFVREFVKAQSMKAPADSKALDKVASSITCTFFGIEEDNFFSMTFKNKNDGSDYQLEFIPAGGYRSWVATSGKTEQCFTVRVLDGGFSVKDPNTNESYAAYVVRSVASGTEVVNSCQ